MVKSFLEPTSYLNNINSFESPEQQASYVAKFISDTAIIHQMNKFPKNSYFNNKELLLQHGKDLLKEISSELLEGDKDYTRELGQEMQQDLAEYEMKLTEEAAKAMLNDTITIDIESENDAQDINQYSAADTFEEFTDFNIICPLEPIAA